MKQDIFELYISGVEFVSLVIAVVIVFITSPVWSLLYLGCNMGTIIDFVEEKMERGKNNE